MKREDKKAIVNMLLTIRYYFRVLREEKDPKKLKVIHDNASILADAALGLTQEVA